jgi:PAS domain S-box-containing protein
MNFYALISLIGAVLSLALGFFVVAREPSNRVHRMFLLFCLSVAYWCFTEYGYRQAELYAIASFWLKLSAICPLVISVFLHFALVYTGIHTSGRRRWILPLVYGPAIMFSLIDLPTSKITGQPMHAYWGWTYSIPHSIWYHLYIGWSTVVMFLVAFLCFRYFAVTIDRQRRKQAMYVAFGFLLPIVLGFVTEGFLPYVNIRIPELTTLGFAIANVVIGYAIWRHELFTLSPATAADRIITTMNNALFLNKPERTIQTVNGTATALLESAENELLGRPVVSLFPDAAFMQATMQKLALDRISRAEIETTMRTSSGREVPISLSMSAMVDRTGALQGMILIGRDITQRKAAQEALQRAHDELEVRVRDRTAELAESNLRVLEEKELLAVTLGSIGDGVITTDNDGVVILMNGTAESLTGWTAAEATGRPIKQVLNLETADKGVPVPDPVKQVLEAKTVIELPDGCTLIAKDGSRRRIADSGAPIANASGAIIGVVLVFRDVTERQLLEQELVKMKKLESVGILAGGIAHDFNNLLTGIAMNLFIAKTEIPPEQKAHEFIREAEAATFRATRLTQQLLTFAKGGKPVRKVDSIADLITDATGFLLSGTTVNYVLDLEKDLLPVLMDKGQIDQVLSNVVINAKQVMTQGGTITIKGENVAVDVEGFAGKRHAGTLNRLRPGLYVKISVCDQGPGISPEIIDRIFDPYFTTKSEGSGLGLTIAYSIIQKHEGTLTVESVPGSGSVFSFYLPAAPEAPSTPADTAIHGVPLEKVQKARRILIMDDEPAIRKAMAGLLEKLGFEVVGAANGEEAVRIFTEAHEAGRNFSLVILDLTVVGGMGGKECVRLLARVDPSVRAIVSSGYSTDPAMAAHAAFGFAAALPKPYELEQLMAVIHQVLEESPR